MTTLEDQLRTGMHAVADQAPDVASIRESIVRPGSPAADADISHSRWWARRGSWLLAAAATVAIVASTATLAYLRDAEQPIRMPAVSEPLDEPSPYVVDLGSPPNQRAAREVQAFLDRELAQHPQVQATAEWKSNTLWLPIDPPVPDHLARLNGAIVGGLQVRVLPAGITNQDFSAFMKDVGRTDFPGKERIEGFGLNSDATSVTILIRGLEDMADSERQALSKSVEEATNEPFLLLPGPATTLLGPT